MKILSVETTPFGECKLICQNMSYQFLNIMRRIMIGEIPVFGIGDIDIYQNNSVYYDEIVKHRLNLIPIFLNKQHKKISDHIQFVLDIENKSDSILYVTSSDIKVIHNELKEELDSSSFLKKNPLTNDSIQLFKLQPNSKIDLSMRIIENMGMNNIAFSPVSVVTFNEYKHNTMEYLFESVGIMSNKDILTKTLNIILNHIENLLSQLNKNEINIRCKDDNIEIYLINQYNKGMILYYMLNQYLSDTFEFVGQKLVHPLTKEICITIFCESKMERKDINLILMNGFNKMLKDISELKESSVSKFKE